MNVKIGMFDLSITPPGKTDHAVDIICKSVHLNCTLVPFFDFNYGDVDSNGLATYRIKDIQDGLIDTFHPDFTPTYRRFQAIDFSQPVFYSDLLMITRAPTQPNLLFDPSLFTVLPWQVWCLLIAALVLISCLIIFLIRKNQASSKFHLLISALSIFSSLITHKHDEKFLHNSSFRLKITCWSLVTMVLSASYTGMLFSQNLKPIDFLPYDDFDSFITCLEDARCRWVTTSTTSSYFQILTAPEGASGRRIQATFQKRPPLVMNPADILDAIYQQKDVYLVWISSRSSFGAHYQSRGGCPVCVIEAPYKEVWAFPVRKGSPLKELLNWAATGFTELGLGEGLSARTELDLTMYDQNHFRGGRKSGDRSMIITAMCIFGIATPLSILALIVEIRKNQ